MRWNLRTIVDEEQNKEDNEDIKKDSKDKKKPGKNRMLFGFGV